MKDNYQGKKEFELNIGTLKIYLDMYFRYTGVCNDATQEDSSDSNVYNERFSCGNVTYFAESGAEINRIQAELYYIKNHSEHPDVFLKDFILNRLEYQLNDICNEHHQDQF